MARKRVSAGPNGRRIRVMHVQDKCGHGGSQIQGVQRLLLWWWPAFENTEFDLSLCILRGRNAASRSFDEAGIPVTYLGRGRFDPRTIYDLRRLIHRKRIDLLHCHGYGSTTFGRVAGSLCRIPVIVHEHMIDDRIPTYQRIVDRILSPATARAIAVSKAVREFMIHQRGIPPEKVDIVYNGIPESYAETQTEEEKRRIESELGVARDGYRLVGIVGRLHPIKGHLDFLCAAAQLVRRQPCTRFVVVGDGDMRPDLEDKAKKLGIAGRVHFAGHREDIPAVLALLDVLVISSYSEGCPLSVLEGMAAGKAIVSTRVGGIPELIDDDETGVLVPAGDPTALAKAVERVLDDRVFRERVQCKAKKEFRQRFLVARTAEAIGSVYLSALGYEVGLVGQ